MKKIENVKKCKDYKNKKYMENVSEQTVESGKNLEQQRSTKNKADIHHLLIWNLNFHIEFGYSKHVMVVIHRSITTLRFS